MTILTRQTQKVFAGNANASQIAVMGSMKTGTPDYQTDLDKLQSASYELGWDSALLADKAPYLEEMNGVQYGFSYQLTYLLQEGIPEYDANTAYSLNSIVKVVSGNELKLYHPIQLDSNGECRGHALTDNAWWQQVYFINTTAIGQPQLSLNATLPDGLPPENSSFIWLEGQAVSRSTYSALFAIYGTTYGSGDGSTTFNLPNFSNRALWGYNGSFGTIAAGLPNITGGLPAGENVYKNFTPSYGAFYSHKANVVSGKSSNTDFDNDFWYFNASKSNSIYGNSNTVQPPAIKVRVYTRWK